MSDKPRPAAGKASAKPPGKDMPSEAAAKPKAKPAADETFDFLAPPQQPGELGRLAHYRVLKVLGKGGMGIVFQAEDTRLNRTVGLKVMLPAMAKKPVAHDRFIREARATAAIEHDHIVTIYEVNEDQGVPYLAMQYLKGATLEDFLKRGKALNIPQIMRIGKEIAKGLAAAHACKHIHRDIKPSNIWLDSTNRGRVKILDFGLARPTNAETNLTQVGIVLGSPAYMAPEQAYGQPIDERCDLFSLGCVLYRLCAGRLPFAGKDATSVLLAITSAEPRPLSEANPELPRALTELVHQLLAKKPEDRPSTAKVVVQRLQEIERDWVAQSNTQSQPVVQLPPAAPVQPTTAIAAGDAPGAESVPDESAIMDLEWQSSDPPDIRKPAPGRSWLVAGLSGALIAIVSAFCCLGLVIATDYGWVKIDAMDERSAAFLEQTGLTVLDHHKKPRVLRAGTHQLPTGGYTVALDNLPAGVRVEPNLFSVYRRETVEIKVHFSRRPRPEIVSFDADQAKKIQREWAAFLNVPISETLPGGIKIVLIPPGEFEMGSARQAIAQQVETFSKRFKMDRLGPQFAANLKSESPRHSVRITKPFWLGECEITIRQFTEFVRAESYVTIPEKDKRGGAGIDNGALTTRKPAFTWKNTGVKNSGEHPVSNITWQDAEAFCAWLSQRTNRDCRLPTEAEWEYACRAGTTTSWSFSNDLKSKESAKHMWFHPLGKLAVLTGTHPVAQKGANPFGLYDMHGNVEEMCQDYWTPDYYDHSPKTDPPGPAAGAKATLRVARGGSFMESPFLCRSASRNPLDPALGYVQVGFRIVCAAPLPPD